MYIGQRAKNFGSSSLPKSFQGIYDGKVRVEISDENASLDTEKIRRANPEEPVPLSSILLHDDLYREYPFLESLNVNVQNTDANEGASYFPRQAAFTITINTPPELLLEYVIHEVQHCIQQLEGFEPGGSPALLFLQKRIKAKDDLGVRINELPAELEDELKRQSIAEYTLMGGEIEARDTGARLKMTAREREETPPYSSENIPASSSLPGLKLDKFTETLMSATLRTKQYTAVFRSKLMERNTERNEQPQSSQYARDR